MMCNRYVIFFPGFSRLWNGLLVLIYSTQPTIFVLTWKDRKQMVICWKKCLSLVSSDILRFSWTPIICRNILWSGAILPRKKTQERVQDSPRTQPPRMWKDRKGLFPQSEFNFQFSIFSSSIFEYFIAVHKQVPQEV